MTNTFTETIVQLGGPPPPNDDCADAIPVFAGSSTCGTTVCATPSLPGTLFPAPCGNSAASPDVWYKFTAQCGGTVTFSTCGTNCAGTPPFNTVLSVYSGVCGHLIQAQGAAGCNDNYCGAQSRVVLSNLLACSTYYIRVAGFIPRGAPVPPTGDFILNVSEVSTPPVNDLCANAFIIRGGLYHFDNCGANTDGPNSPPNCPSYNDVWYKYTPPCDGQVSVETCKSCFPTVLSVYTGSCVNLNLVACNQSATAGHCNGSLNSFVSFSAIGGIPYYIRVGSATPGDTGGGFLTVNGPYPPVGTCPPAVGPTICRYFTVVGTANDTPWSWSIQSECCANIQVPSVPGVPVGGTAANLADAFVASINGVGCAGLQAMRVGPPILGWFRICSTVCTNPGVPLSSLSFVFRVGAAGTPPEDQCVVIGPVLPTAGPCSFNPEIFELPTSGQDLNNNGIDDAIDILAGTSLDLDQNDIPDEAQSCLPPILTDVPDSQTVDPGMTVTLSAQSAGNSPLAYRWSINGNPLADGGNISGSASNVLTIQSIAAANLGDYTISAQNACGTQISPPATLSFQTLSSPAIVNPAIISGVFQFAFQTQDGVNYVVEFSDSLSSPNWTPLETIQGDGTLRQAADLLPQTGTRFYRVRSISP
jgi:hypothetical protein